MKPKPNWLIWLAQAEALGYKSPLLNDFLRKRQELQECLDTNAFTGTVLIDAWLNAHAPKYDVFHPVINPENALLETIPEENPGDSICFWDVGGQDSIQHQIS